MRLINERSYCGTSIEDIIKATGAKKGNLHFYFFSKEELGLAIVEETNRQFSAFLSKILHGDRPLDKLSNFLDAILKKHKNSGFAGG